MDKHLLEALLRQLVCADESRASGGPERPVMVTTDKRGVFFGYATDTSGDTIRLRAARMAVYWSKAMHGVLGLAEIGPDSDCRISKAADIELRGITGVAEVTPEAAKKWEAAPWR